MPNTQNFDQIRENMVDCQINPMGVFDEKILDAFMTVPREEFVPDNMRGIAYVDEDIDIGNGRYLIEPSIIARLMDKAALKGDDVVLTIGSGSGYTAALLSKIVSTVVSLEEDENLLAKSQEIWDRYAFCNIVGISGALKEGAAKHAPYSLIIINGCVAHVPQKIKDQLGEGGRLLTVIRPSGSNTAQALLVEKIKEGVFSDRILFDASTPYLLGFEPEDRFKF